jgi:hypothetical protein
MELRWAGWVMLSKRPCCECILSNDARSVSPRLLSYAPRQYRKPCCEGMAIHFVGLGTGLGQDAGGLHDTALIEVSNQTVDTQANIFGLSLHEPIV